MIKILRYLNENSNMKLIESKHVAYSVKNTYYVDTHYNNTFRFEGETVKLTVYFQPVIYADDKSVNGIWSKHR